jgi:hypothetical protein
MLAVLEYYLLIFVVFLQCLFIKKIGKWPLLILIALELWFLSAFRRWDIGNDTSIYVSAFVYMYTPFSEVFGQGRMEQGYRILNQFIGLFSHNPQTILIVTSAIIISSRFFTIARYSAYAGFTVILFVIMQFGTTLNLIRQEMAFSIVLFALPFIIKRQLIPYLIFCLLAMQVHLTAITAIMIYFFYNLPWKKKYVLSIVFGGILGLVLLSPLLNTFASITGRYGGYLGSNYAFGEEIKLGSIMAVCVSFVILMFEGITYKIYKQKMDSQLTYLPANFLLFMTLMTFIAYLMSLRAVGLSRVAFYFNFFTIFSLPVFIRVYPRKICPFITLAIVGGFIAQASIIFIFRPSWNHWLPYYFCF